MTLAWIQFNPKKYWHICSWHYEERDRKGKIRKNSYHAYCGEWGYKNRRFGEFYEDPTLPECGPQSSPYSLERSRKCPECIKANTIAILKSHN
jgi:hypothetical protein